MDREKRCEDCIRPICQRVITLKSCIYRKKEPIIGEPLNGYFLPDIIGNA